MVWGGVRKVNMLTNKYILNNNPQSLIHITVETKGDTKVVRHEPHSGRMGVHKANIISMTKVIGSISKGGNDTEMFENLVALYK